MSKIPKTPLTRQHFEYFAWCAGLVVDEQLATYTKKWLAEVLAGTSPAFDKERFLARCEELRREYTLEGLQ